MGAILRGVSLQPFFSVIIPTYNRADLLEVAIKSVLAQEYTNYEIVVADDSSTDNTPEVIESFNSDKIKYVRLTHCGIVGRVRNTGIKWAEGDYIAFLDSDDVWYPHKLMEMVGMILAHPEAVLFCHDMIEGDRPFIHRYGPYEIDMHRRLLFRDNCIGTSATIVQGKALQDIGFFSESPYFIGAEDYECWMRLCFKGRFCFVPQVLGEYRPSVASVSRDMESITRARLNVVNHHYQNYLTHKSQETLKLIKKRRAMILMRSARTLQLDRRFDEAVSFYMRSLNEALIVRSLLGLVSSILKIRLGRVAKVHMRMRGQSVNY